MRPSVSPSAVTIRSVCGRTAEPPVPLCSHAARGLHPDVQSPGKQADDQGLHEVPGRQRVPPQWSRLWRECRAVDPASDWRGQPGGFVDLREAEAWCCGNCNHLPAAHPCALIMRCSRTHRMAQPGLIKATHQPRIVVAATPQGHPCRSACSAGRSRGCDFSGCSGSQVCPCQLCCRRMWPLCQLQRQGGTARAACRSGRSHRLTGMNSVA